MNAAMNEPIGQHRPPDPVPKGFAAQLRDFFGLLPGQGLKEFATYARAQAGLATYRGIGRCQCGKLVPLFILARWQGQEPTSQRTSVAGACCPGCGAALAPETVASVGIYGLGWPAIPSTPVSVSDLGIAMELL